MTFPASELFITPSSYATNIMGSWYDVAPNVNREAPLGRRIYARAAVAYDEAWNAWFRLADGAISAGEEVLTYEPESEAALGTWTKDEYGIPFFQVTSQA